MIRLGTASRKLDFKWSILVAMVCLDFVWMLADGWSFQQGSLVMPTILLSAASIPLFIRRYREDDLISSLCESVIFSLILTWSAAIFSYLAVSANFPLVDQSLATADKFLAFSWADYYSWSITHDTFQSVLVEAYGTLAKQSWLVVFFLCITRRKARIREFLELTAALFAISILLSIFIPAAGAPKFYASSVHVDVSGWSHLELLRAGSLKLIDLNSMQGLVSMPSVHTVMAILLCWAVRSTRLACIIIPLNILVLLSTPVVGGHYIADVLAGALLTADAIAIRNRLMRRSAETIDHGTPLTAAGL